MGHVGMQGNLWRYILGLAFRDVAPVMEENHMKQMTSK